MTPDRRLLGAALGFALVVAACSSSPSSSAAASAAPSAASSQAAAASADASSAPNVSMPDISLAPGAASDLEGMLPSTVGQVTFQKTSVDGSQIAGAGTPFDTSKMDPTLSKYGKTIADVRMAIATGTGGSGAIPDEVFAIQLKGVPATQWASDADSSLAASSTITVGGKQVLGSSVGGMTSGVYLKDDIMFMVIASDADAAQIFTALP